MRLPTVALLLLATTAVAQLNLRGDRFPGLTYEELTPAQKVIADRADPSESSTSPCAAPS
jgi:hypothetical protein